MKKLKNNSQEYIEIILASANDYISREKSNLLELYNIVGKAIAEQGEKAFIPHLVNILVENFPKLKGFSARNLRRMRDFYNTYKDRPDLFEKAKTLSWTINCVIIENLESYDEYEFYLKLAEKETLSKLSLLSAINESVHMKTTETEVSKQEGFCDTFKVILASNTTRTTKTNCRAFVSRCRACTHKNTPHCLVKNKLWKIFKRMKVNIHFNFV